VQPFCPNNFISCDFKKICFFDAGVALDALKPSESEMSESVDTMLALLMELLA
jgi:hypothetical protein